MKKIISVVGARPQFIKLAALSPELRKYFKEYIVNSGQHYDFELATKFFEELNIPEPDFNLGVGSGDTIWQISQILIKMDEVLKKVKPDLVIVFGDTNTTAAAAIATVKNNIKLAHVEAGLREFNKCVPEETNKLLTDIVSDYFFTPTQTGLINLKNMGISKNVYHVGDVSLDLIIKYKNEIDNNRLYNSKFNLKEKEFIFFTCHRAANTDNIQNLKNIIGALSKIDKKVIFPVHPRTKKVIEDNNLKGLMSENIIPIDPIGFIDTQSFIKNSYCCITDSGGVIKEAYFHKVPAIIVDTQTEWVETLEEGWNHLAGPNTENILKMYNNLKIPNAHSQAIGDGYTSEKVAAILNEEL